MLNSFIPSKVLTVAVLLGLATASPVFASNVDDQLQGCAQLTSDPARLACFDQLVASMAAASTSDAAPDAAQEIAPVVAAAPVADETVRVDPSTGAPIKSAENDAPTKNTDTFGTAEEQKQSIRVMLEKTKRNSRGDWYFYFDNGEVWKQIDTRNRRIPPLPVAATVSRGIFSSHKLHIDGEVWSMKIRRVK